MSSDSNGHSTYLNIILFGKDSFISSSSVGLYFSIS